MPVDAGEGDEMDMERFDDGGDAWWVVRVRGGREVTTDTEPCMCRGPVEVPDLVVWTNGLSELLFIGDRYWDGDGGEAELVKMLLLWWLRSAGCGKWLDWWLNKLPLGVWMPVPWWFKWWARLCPVMYPLDCPWLACAARDGGNIKSTMGSVDFLLVLYLLFWNQILTCVSVSFKMCANSVLSGPERYFWCANRRSNSNTWAWVKAALDLFFFFFTNRPPSPPATPLPVRRLSPEVPRRPSQPRTEWPGPSARSLPASSNIPPGCANALFIGLSREERGDPCQPLPRPWPWFSWRLDAKGCPMRCPLDA